MAIGRTGEIELAYLTDWGYSCVPPGPRPAQSGQAAWFMYIATLFGNVCQLLNVGSFNIVILPNDYQRFPLVSFDSLTLSPPLLERPWACWA